MSSSALWSFEGRASRSKFWLVFLLSIFVSFVVVLFTLLAMPALILMGIFSPVVASVTSILLNVLLIPMWIISIATTVRRFHDRNKSGWWYLIALVPVIGFFWIIIECGFLKGTTGPNNFGDEEGGSSGGPGSAGTISSPPTNKASSSKLIISVIVGIILIALIGRAIWAYQQVKSDEATLQAKKSVVAIDTSVNQPPVKQSFSSVATTTETVTNVPVKNAPITAVNTSRSSVSVSTLTISELSHKTISLSELARYGKDPISFKVSNDALAKESCKKDIIVYLSGESSSEHILCSSYYSKLKNEYSEPYYFSNLATATSGGYDGTKRTYFEIERIDHMVIEFYLKDNTGKESNHLKLILTK